MRELVVPKASNRILQPQLLLPTPCRTETESRMENVDVKNATRKTAILANGVQVYAKCMDGTSSIHGRKQEHGHCDKKLTHTQPQDRRQTPPSTHTFECRPKHAIHAIGRLSPSTNLSFSSHPFFGGIVVHETTAYHVQCCGRHESERRIQFDLTEKMNERTNASIAASSLAGRNSNRLMQYSTVN
jgi:hypothetical protein